VTRIFRNDNSCYNKLAIRC